MSDCTPECLTGDPDTMSSQCVRALQEENARLKRRLNPVGAYGKARKETRNVGPIRYPGSTPGASTNRWEAWQK